MKTAMGLGDGFAPERTGPRASTARLPPARLPARIGVALARAGGLRSVIRVLEHEMRAPLATSLLQLAAAQAALAAASTEGAQAALAGAMHQLRALSLIVRRAVQIETAEPIDFCPERVDLAERVVAFVGARASWSRVAVRADKPVVGEWDAAAVEQILENLVSNALKFGEGRPVSVSVAPVRGGARLAVRDEGAGIEPKDRERIFDRFARLPSTRAIAGLGIGLWVVRHVVSAHGGRVLVRSRPGRGTIVEVWLPQIAPYPAPAPSATSLPVPGSAAGPSSSLSSAVALARRGSKGPIRRSPCSAAKRTRSPTL
jgi:signal transduction histidine kinase